MELRNAPQNHRETRRVFERLSGLSNESQILPTTRGKILRHATGFYGGQKDSVALRSFYERPEESTDRCKVLRSSGKFCGAWEHSTRLRKIRRSVETLCAALEDSTARSKALGAEGKLYGAFLNSVALQKNRAATRDSWLGAPAFLPASYFA